MAHLQSCARQGNCWLALGETLAPKGSWQSSPLNCCEDAGSCCFGLFCLPLAYGGNHDKLRGGGTGGPCLTYCLLSLACLCAGEPGRARGRAGGRVCRGPGEQLHMHECRAADGTRGWALI